MSSSNENNPSFETQKKIINPKIYDEVELISSNQKMANTDTSGIIKVSQNDILSKRSSINTSISSIDLVYGTSIDMHNPRKIGSMNVFFYIKNFPLIVIGPDCK